MTSYRKILYVSSLCSEKLLNHIFETAKIKPRQEAQKFHKLLVEGFALNTDICLVETLSLIPVTSSSHRKKVWIPSQEKTENVHYNYVPLLNLPILRDLGVFIYSFFKVLGGTIFKKSENRIVICDSLKLSISGAAILACKFSGIKVIGIITDLPNLMVGNKKWYNLKYKIYKKLTYTVISGFDKYILLTLQMNEVINTDRKPYLVMEGLVDVKMKEIDNVLEQKDSNRVLIYAGGIYEEYGIKMLMEAFMKLEDVNLRLHIFGPGDMEKEMPAYTRLDKRIIYKGIVPNKEVVNAQLKATLLINPRPTKEDFAKYSFPSKNMEYMVSGTPILTTRLPGMPLEYNDYVYLFEDETVEGMANTLKVILSKSDNELMLFGAKARQFVLNNKSNLIQAKRILDFI